MRAREMRRPLRAGLMLAATLAAACGLLPSAAPAAPPPIAAPTDTSRITYMAGASFYLGAGRDHGIAEGDTVAVMGGGAPGARLVVTAVSTQRAVCTPLDPASAPRVGDLVLFHRRAVAPRAAPPQAAVRDTAAGGGVPAAAAPMSAARPAVRGRISAGYLRIDGPSTGYSRPALDVRAEGRTAWGSPVDFAADVRGYRVTTSGTNRGAARVYRLSASLAGAEGGRRLTAGRQSLPFASAPGLFDGLHFEVARPKLSAGLFSGFEPLSYGYEFHPGVLWSGFYAGARAGTGARQWSFTVGGMDAHDHGIPSRLEAFAQGSYRTPIFSLFGAQALDWNSSWKQARGEPAISSTSTLLTARARVSKRVTLSGGYDGRRNVLLARDRETPETVFDDRFRQGGWTGVSVEPGWASRLDGSARWTSGGAAGTAWAWTGSAERRSIPPLDARVSLRATRVESDFETGWLRSGSLSIRVGGSSEIAFSAGDQAMTEPLGGLERRTSWQGVDADLGFQGRWYALLQGAREKGDAGESTTGYAGLSWRF